MKVDRGDSDSASSCSGGQSSSKSSKGDFSSSTEDVSTSTNTGNHREIPAELAYRETRAVKHSRTLVFLVLLVSATVAGAVTYIFSSREEISNFESQFDDYALEIEDVSQHNARTIFGLVEGVTLTMTSFTLFTEMNWPLVTLPHYEIRAGQLLNISGADFAALSPIVTEGTKQAWEAYAVENQGWIRDGLNALGELGENNEIPSIPANIFPAEESTGSEEKYYLPVWQNFPTAEDPSTVNFDLLTDETFRRIFDFVMETKAPALSPVIDVTPLFGVTAPNSSGHPQSLLVKPVFDNFENEASVVAIFTAILPWDLYFTNVLHDGAQGLVCVLRDSCGDAFTYQINGSEATYLGEGDLHDPAYDDLVHTSDFSPFLYDEVNEAKTARTNCKYSLFIYPSDELRDFYVSKKPAWLTAAVVGVFFFTSLVFMLYDYLVQKRQTMVMDSAQKSNAIVSSLFPADIRDRLFKNSDSKRAKKAAKESDSKKHSFLPSLPDAPKMRLKSFLNEAELDNNKNSGEAAEPNDLAGDIYESKPIADLFLHTTVMFADISGFTAWSSVREPCQVFTLLETVYHAFDTIAKRRRVFKVETIGDCYVAVSGLPEPRKDHAVVMARFARDCMEQMNELTTKLEVTLGPDTGDLTMRFGLHSGPVTAGVLRGDKSRFQLFGDTVNTAARMESTGERDRIHMSLETADLLKAAGKERWYKARSEKVVAKGKGEMETFWLQTKNGSFNGHGRGKHEEAKADEADDDEAEKTGPSCDDSPTPAVYGGQRFMEVQKSAKIQRLVGWNCDVLLRLLKQIVAARVDQVVTHDDEVRRLEEQIGRSSTVLEEVAEFVSLPDFCKSRALNMDPMKVQLNPKVVTQLHEFITLIASMYQGNPFHNFEHASHVTMSVSKLLSRIVEPEETSPDKNGCVRLSLHDQTHGITSDPLTQFSVVLSALIHDVDHRGVPNHLLIKENARLAAIYRNKSVAEQNSVDLAWAQLMDDRFAELRACIYANTTELVRFRQLIVTTVLATDIFDKELGALRKNRWDKAFSTENHCPDDVHRKATIVIEHLIQASDVAHTMQHWQIFQKWNERLFEEMYDAYKTGRSEVDPSTGWYQGELGFFDNYVIPLGKKLKDCGVFGVSSDEYLNYALENRREWATRGQDVVEKMIEKCSANKPISAGSMHE